MVTVKEESGKLLVTSPYHPDLPARAKKKAGRWDASHKVWVFDARDRDAVADVYRTIYGEWPGDTIERISTVRITVKDNHGEERGQSQSTAAKTPPGRRMRAISANVAPGSIQCNDCTQVTMSAQASASPVPVEVPS